MLIAVFLCCADIHLQEIPIHKVKQTVMTYSRLGGGGRCAPLAAASVSASICSDSEWSEIELDMSHTALKTYEKGSKLENVCECSLIHSCKLVV